MAIERGILHMHRECRWPEPEFSDFGRGNPIGAEVNLMRRDGTV